MIRRLFTAAAVLALAGCQTPGATPGALPSIQEQQVIALELVSVPARDRVEVALALAIEVGARFRCPADPLAIQLLFSARLGYDIGIRPRISAASNAVVDSNRDRANKACSIGAPVEPPQTPAP
jgi:hypothetical protein